MTAVLLSVPVAVGVTTKVTLAVNSHGRNRSQLIILVPLQVPFFVETETKFTPAGNVSVMWTGHPAPTLSPDTIMEYVRLRPTATGSGESVINTPTSKQNWSRPT